MFPNCLGPLVRAAISLTVNLFKPLAKNVLLPLGLTAAATTYGGTQKKVCGYEMTTLIMKDIMKLRYWRNQWCHGNSYRSWRIWFIA